MKEKFRIALFALLAGAFMLSAGGCDGTSKPLYQDEYAVRSTFKELIKKQLRDPDSYEFISAEPIGAELKDGRFWTIRYRAKNGFGGYNTCKAVVSCDSTRMVLIANE